MSIKVDTAKLDELIRTTHDRMTHLVLTLGEDTATEAQKLAPVKSGELRDSISASLAGQSTAWVEAMAEHARAIELGSPPHEIRPKYKKALYWDGAEHPVKRVHHPGNAPQPYLRPALEKVRQDLLSGKYDVQVAGIMLK